MNHKLFKDSILISAILSFIATIASQLNYIFILIQDKLPFNLWFSMFKELVDNPNIINNPSSPCNVVTNGRISMYCVSGTSDSLSTPNNTTISILEIIIMFIILFTLIFVISYVVRFISRKLAKLRGKAYLSNLNIDVIIAMTLIILLMIILLIERYPLSLLVQYRIIDYHSTLYDNLSFIYEYELIGIAIAFILLSFIMLIIETARNHKRKICIPLLSIFSIVIIFLLSEFITVII